MKKIYVITGASRGIGKECAIKVSNENSVVILLASKKENCIEVEALCKEKGAEAYSYGINLANTKKIKELIESIKKEHGSIDVLINNAGIFENDQFLEGDMDVWDNALDVNIKEGGAVIFIASVSSKMPYASGTNYCAGKFAQLGFANSLFLSIQERGIKVSSILPGVVNTDMHKGSGKYIKEKMIQPQDIAETVSFILNMPNNVCPTEITIWPQKNPKRG